MTLLVEGVGLGHELRALRERGGGEERCEPARSATLARPGLRADQRVDPAKRASARAHYLEGVGLRATERLVGVSHKAVMNWVLEAVEGRALAAARPEEVDGVAAAELWTYCRDRGIEDRHMRQTIENIAHFSGRCRQSYGLGSMWAKKTAYWLWWAIDRATKQVCGWTLGDRGTATARRLDAPLPHAPHIIFGTDF